MAVRQPLATIPEPEPIPEIGKWLEVPKGGGGRVDQKFLHREVTLVMALSTDPGALRVKIVRVPKNNGDTPIDGYEVHYSNGLTQFFTVPSAPVTGNMMEPVPGLPFFFSVDSDGTIVIHNHQGLSPVHYRLEKTDEALHYGKDIHTVPTGQDETLMEGFIDGNKKIIGSTTRAQGYSKYSETNEDSAGFSKKRLVVADGLGGNFHSELASHQAVVNILTNGGTFPQAISDAQTYLNYYNNNFSRWVGKIYSPDTVLAAAEIHGNKISVAHVGDCRYRLFHKGKIIAASEDHSLTREKVKAGKITEKEALTDPEGHIVTRTLSHSVVDFAELDAPPGSIFMLCSDGLRGVTDQEIIELHNKNMNRYMVLDEVLKLVRLRNTTGRCPGEYKENGVTKVEQDISVSPYDNTTVMFVYF